MVFLLRRRGEGAGRQRKGWRSWSLDVSSRHSMGLENKRIFCFVFSDSCVSVEESLPGTALPLEPGCEREAQGLAAPVFHSFSLHPAPPPPKHTLKRRGN